MFHVDSFDSSISDLSNAPASSYAVGDRVRRVATSGGPSNVTGTVRFVGPMHNAAANTVTASPAAGAAAAGGGAQAAEDEQHAAAPPTAASAPSVASLDSLDARTVSTGFDAGTNRSSLTASPQIWIGVEWDYKHVDGDAPGKNDGSVGGHRYFSCRPGHGSLVQAKSLTKGRTLAQMLEVRYGSSTIRQDAGPLDEDVRSRSQTRPMQLGPAIGFREPDTGAFSKVISSDCTANAHLQLVCTAGDNLATFFPNLRELSLASTLFASWVELAAVGDALPNLRSLDVSRNPALALPSRSPLASDGRTVVSTSVTELRISDVGKLTPDCIRFLFDKFPAVEVLYAARCQLELDNSQPAPAASPLLLMSGASTPTASATGAAAAAGGGGAGGGGGDQEAGGGAAATAAAAGGPRSKKLSYLNLEGNPIVSLDSIANLIGPERCATLTTLNLSATRIADAPMLPAAHVPSLLDSLTSSQRSPGAPATPEKQPRSSPPTSPSASSSSEQQQQQPAPDSPGDSPARDRAGSEAPSGAAMSNTDDTHEFLFPRLTSIFLSHSPISSFAALSRVLHRATGSRNLTDVHFSTATNDNKNNRSDDDEEQENNNDNDDNDNNNENNNETHHEEEEEFLPEDFRDRRRLLVAFMPPTVKKVNRSEITQTERAQATHRSIVQFHDMVRSPQSGGADDQQDDEEDQQQQQQDENDEEAEEERRVAQLCKGLCMTKLGQLPHHLRRAIVNEQRKTTGSGGRGGGGAGSGAGFIYRPPQHGPRRLLNEFPVNLVAVFLRDRDHFHQMFASRFEELMPLHQQTPTSSPITAVAPGAMPTTASSSSPGSQQPAAAAEGAAADAGGNGVNYTSIPLEIDVRWEASELERAVREAIGVTDARTSVRLVHIDRELMSNPGAVTAGIHVKELKRPAEKLHMSKVAPGDFIVACVGP